MPTFRLSGFAQGVPVAISVIQGAASSSVIVPSWGTPPGDFPQLIHDAETGFEIRVLSEDVLGALTFSVTVDGALLGPFERTAAQQVSGLPVNHLAPTIAETANLGLFASTTGLWSHGLSTEPALSYQWTRDGTAIEGATAASYARVAADAGSTLRCVVTVNGVIATSNEVATAVTSAFRADYRGAGRINSASSSSSATIPGLPIGSAADRDVLYVLASHAISTTVATRSATLGGQAGTQLGFVRVNNGNGRLCEVSVWAFVGVTGDSAVPFVFTVPAGNIDFLHAAVVSARAVASSVLETDSDSAFINRAFVVSQNLLAGDFVVAVAHSFNGAALSYTDSGQFASFGLTEQLDRRTRTDSGASATVIATHAAIATETPRPMTVTVSPIEFGMVAASLRLRG